MSTLNCDIVTPEAKFYSDQASFVVLPGLEGDMGIYEKHEPVVTSLRPGKVKVVSLDEKDELNFAVIGGFAQIDGQNVEILSTKTVDLSTCNREDVESELSSLQSAFDGFAADDPKRANTELLIKWNELLLSYL
ncbi:MAG: ATP synthase F1 subunit epsilon [Coriobacteriales bacterium]|nr:ATP synthase F1 subunit epsilon [Coriobacteriales bacterium]